MFVVNSLPVAIVFCVITMLGWGSWANTQKLAGKEKWPFQLFYWDYAIGVFLFGIVLAHTLGSYGPAGAPARANMHAADFTFVLPALFSGALFNLSKLSVWWLRRPGHPQQNGRHERMHSDAETSGHATAGHE